MMKDERIIQLIEAYGANPDAWPEADQAVGRAALADPSDAVRFVLDDYAALDALFAEMPALETPSHLTADIIENAPARQAPAPKSTNWLISMLGPRWAGQLTAAAASLFVGLGIGLGTATAESENDAADAAIYAALGISMPGAFLDETIDE